MLLRFLTFAAALISLIWAVPLEPGQPGGPWTEEEIGIVRDKIVRMMQCQDDATYDFTWHSPNYNGQPNAACWTIAGLPDMLDEEELDLYSRDHDEYLGPRAPWSEMNQPNVRYKWRERGPKASRLVQLAFHDCFRYQDGSGGCDGCINWAGVGYGFPRGKGIFQEKKNPDLYKSQPKNLHTSNNKLQLTARSLELIYTIPDWPPGAPALPISLKNSGKSRADLWQLAGNVGLEHAIGVTNDNCQNLRQEGGNTEYYVSAIDGIEGCEIKLDRTLPFRWGRVDCIPDEEAKWTPYPFEATKSERHSNTYGTGTQVMQDLKQDFDLTARESISLMALHGLAARNFNFEEFTKYKWIGGTDDAKGSISRMYYKFLNGAVYEPFQCFGCSHPGYHVGDINGNPVDGTSFGLHCHGGWETTTRVFGGPCHFRFAFGCKPQDDPDLEMRKPCFEQRTDGSGFDQKTDPGCDSAELIERDGFLIQTGGPARNRNELCRKRSTSFAMPYEVSLVLNFTVGEENIPVGCGNLDGPWTLNKKKPDPNHRTEMIKAREFIGSEGLNGSPPCGPNTYAPEGEATADIVANFAADHDAWQQTFFDAWEKMQMNGYDIDELTEGPTNLQAPTSPLFDVRAA